MIAIPFRWSQMLWIPTVVLGTTMALTAQCSNPWLPGEGIPGVQGTVHMTHAWDPDGAGPMPAQIVVGGTFWAAGTVPARNIAAWDPAAGTWTALGGGVGGSFLQYVEAVATLPNGDLVVAGSFLDAGGTPANHVACWDGSSWSTLGSGTDAPIRSAAVLANGDLVVSGFFSSAGGVPAAGVARWNGSSWSAMGSQGNLRDLVAAPDGEIYGLNPAPVRWNGSAWQPIGSFQLVLDTTRLAVLPNSELILVGLAMLNGQLQRLLRWNGTTWSPMVLPPIVPNVAEVAIAPNGDVLLVGGTTIQRWDGATWSAVAELAGIVGLLVLPNGDLVAASSFSIYYTTRLLRWTGSSWAPLGGGTDGPVDKVLVLPDGSRIACGWFRWIGGVAADRIARWDGATWSPLGLGFPAANANLYLAVAMPNGDLVVGGHFTSAGGVAARQIARWDGTAWSALGTPGLEGPSVYVGELLALPNGDLIVGGRFTHAGGSPAANIARWDGVGWSPLGSGADDVVTGLVALPNGDIVASGAFTTIGGVAVDHVARWDGTNWSPFGASPNQIDVQLVSAAGDVVGVRSLTSTTSEVVRGNGGAWTPVGGPFDNWAPFVEELPNGDLVAAGFFLQAGGVRAERIARWNGTTWSPIGAGVGFASVADVVMDHARGELLVAGSFVFAGGEASSYLARVGTDCPASVAPLGTGCAGSGGASTLTAVTLPWVDATFASRATGLPAAAVAVTLLSFTSVPQGAVPLASVFAQAPAGCDLLVAPDIVDVVLANGGVADYAAFLPNTPPLVGLTFFHQMVPFELDLGGNVVAITATNALALTAGTF